MFILLTALLYGTRIVAQPSNVLQYINTYKELAVEEMQRTGVPASIKLAQGILETEAGTSDLVRRSNNHFGIKCKTNWDGDKVYHDDDARGECFRAYATAADSYRDHSDFLRSSARYAFLFKIDPEDYRAWAHGLKKAGYATNPRYTQQLIQYIEDYNLETFTLIALGKKKWTDDPAFAATDKKDEENGFSSIPAIYIHPESAAIEEEPDTEEVAQEAPPDYPEGLFKINETNVIYAPAGSSLLALAEKYSIKYRHILEFNDLGDGDDILINSQLVYLQRKRKQGAHEFHIMRKSETVYEVAQLEGIRMETLLAYNQLQQGQRPAAGEKLFLRDYAAQPPLLAIPNDRLNVPNMAVTEMSKRDLAESRTNMVRHIVQNRETLYSISKKYEVKTDQIREWNNLPSEDIKTGQELIIYKN